jgi:2-polyprenyl-3-methyl-5-hydroxy-6-metoxy-1,4-benzoquinol methylase
MEIKIDELQPNLRPQYDFTLPSIADKSNSRGLVFNAIPTGSHVLDVGCDTGRFGEALRQQKNCVVEGIEPCLEAAEVASGRLDHVFIQPVENERSFDDLKENEYDAILFLDVLEHLVDPWSVLQGVTKVLRPDGSIYVVVPNIAHVSIVRRLLFGRFEYQQYGAMDRTHLRWFTRNSLRQALVDAGFVNVKIEGLISIPYLSGKSKTLNFIAQQIGSLFPDMFSGSILGCGQIRSDS